MPPRWGVGLVPGRYSGNKLPHSIHWCAGRLQDQRLPGSGHTPSPAPLVRDPPAGERPAPAVGTEPPWHRAWSPGSIRLRGRKRNAARRTGGNHAPARQRLQEPLHPPAGGPGPAERLRPRGLGAGDRLQHPGKGQRQLYQRRCARPRGRHHLARPTPRDLVLHLPADRIPKHRRPLDGRSHHDLRRPPLPGSDQTARGREAAPPAPGLSRGDLQWQNTLAQPPGDDRADRAAAGRPATLPAAAPVFLAGRGPGRCPGDGQYLQRYHCAGDRPQPGGAGRRDRPAHRAAAGTGEPGTAPSPHGLDPPSGPAATGSRHHHPAGQ